MQEERLLQEELKRQREEQEAKEYRRSLRFKVGNQGPAHNRGKAARRLPASLLPASGEPRALFTTPSAAVGLRVFALHRWHPPQSRTPALLTAPPPFLPAPTRQARPMPNFDQPFFSHPSDKPLTNPLTPNFATKKRARRE